MDYVDVQIQDRSGVWVTVSNYSMICNGSGLNCGRLHRDILIEG